VVDREDKARADNRVEWVRDKARVISRVKDRIRAPVKKRPSRQMI